MSSEEKAEFKIDAAQFNWTEAMHNQIYGLRRFYLKEDVQPPESSYNQLFQKNRPELFYDIKTALQATANVFYRTNSAYEKNILDTHNFNAYIMHLTS